MDKLTEDYIKGYVDCQMDVLPPIISMLNDLQNICQQQIELGQELVERVNNGKKKN